MGELPDVVKITETVAEAEIRILSARQEPGLVLISLRRPGKILKLNAAAQQILLHAQRPQILARIRAWLAEVDTSTGASAPPLAWTFLSGRRTYTIRTLWLEAPGGPRRVLALLLERINPSRLGIERCRKLYHLSTREVDVITLLAQGGTDKSIADALGVGAETVRGYLKSIRAKLGVSTRTAIVHKISELMNSGGS